MRPTPFYPGASQCTLRWGCVSLCTIQMTLSLYLLVICFLMPSVLLCNFENLFEYTLHKWFKWCSYTVSQQQSSWNEAAINIPDKCFVDAHKLMASVSELSRSWPATLSIQLCGGGSLHVLHQGGGRPEAQGPSHQRHAEERPQTAVDGPAEWWAHTELVAFTHSVTKRPLFLLLILLSTLAQEVSRNKIHYNTSSCDGDRLNLWLYFYRIIKTLRFFLKVWRWTPKQLQAPVLQFNLKGFL